MHIKQITIQGFKSYKSTTDIDPFSPGHNVVVGRNGSGKSNFFSAIRFVLGDAYTNLGREDRQALLHEGSGAAVMTAFVEVIFDNSDGRFLNQKDELILRRTIGQKKDEYSLDRKSATKHDVQSMLEGAGFSRSNPYYIVPQGRVTALTNMKDADRLNLLKEVAGTQVYEDRRQQSKRIMEDTEAKQQKIDESLTFIADRLQELENEKEELKLYQEKDREKRCLEYSILNMDQTQLQQKLDQYEMAQENAQDSTRENSELFARGEQRLQDLSANIADIEQRINVLQLERAQHEEERKSAVKDKAKLELEVSSLKDGHSAAQQAEMRHTRELQDVQRQIAQKEAQLNQLLPRYEAQKSAEHVANRQLAEADAQRQRLFSKQGRQAGYKNRAERDAWLQDQIDNVAMTFAKRKAVTMQIADDIEAIEADIGSLETAVGSLREQLDNRGQDKESCTAQIQEAADERDKLQDRRKEFRREEAKLTSKADYARQELAKAEQSLSQMMDRATSQGLAGVRRIVKEHGIQGVHGMLAELFTPSDEKYKTAIEVSAGTSLFHYVVDTDETAQKLVDIMYKEKAGRITCVPLNRTKTRNVNFPSGNDAIPLVNKLVYEAQYEPAIRQVFGRTVVCTNLSIASQYARSHGVEALTPDGDRADRKGVLSGGYHDYRRSRMDATRSVARWRKELDELTDQLKRVSVECGSLDQLITRAMSNLQKAEQRQKKSDDGHGPMLAELRNKSNEVQAKRDELEDKNRARTNVEEAVRQLSEQSSAYSAEKSSAFKKALTNEEEQELARLSTSVQELRKQANELSVKKSDLEVEKTTIEVELRENLRMRLDQLRAEESDLGGNSQGGSRDTRRLQEQERALQRIEQVLRSAIEQLDATTTGLEQLQASLAKSQLQYEDKQKAQIELSVQTRKDQKKIEKSAGKYALYKVQEQEVTSKIRNLGALPEAATSSRYKNMKYETALGKFHKVKDELKKYGHVNKKAVDQYNQFTRHRETLESRRAELTDGQKSILDLIETLDHRKDDAIERTFKQVSREFATIFERLVPAGRGNLRIQRRVDGDAAADGDSDSDDEERRAARKSGVDSYTGVSIQVSFNSKHDEQQKIQQLSGGQKSLCALALVFAIQASDPAPFYLFDEIDANLDAQYRTAVADMLHESAAAGGQFICTTFRPEMLRVADKCYSVGYKNKTSSIDVCSRDAAIDFIEGQIAGR